MCIDLSLLQIHVDTWLYALDIVVICAVDIRTLYCTENTWDVWIFSLHRIQGRT